MPKVSEAPSAPPGALLNLFPEQPAARALPTELSLLNSLSTRALRSASETAPIWLRDDPRLALRLGPLETPPVFSRAAEPAPNLVQEHGNGSALEVSQATVRLPQSEALQAASSAAVAQQTDPIALLECAKSHLTSLTNFDLQDLETLCTPEMMLRAEPAEAMKLNFMKNIIQAAEEAVKTHGALDSAVMPFLQKIHGLLQSWSAQFASFLSQENITNPVNLFTENLAPIFNEETEKIFLDLIKISCAIADARLAAAHIIATRAQSSIYDAVAAMPEVAVAAITPPVTTTAFIINSTPLEVGNAQQRDCAPKGLIQPSPLPESVALHSAHKQPIDPVSSTPAQGLAVGLTGGTSDDEQDIPLAILASRKRQKASRLSLTTAATIDESQGRKRAPSSLQPTEKRSRLAASKGESPSSASNTSSTDDEKLMRAIREHLIQNK